MKNIRKVLAIVLALTMTLSMSISAMAAVTVEWSKDRYASEATKTDKVPADLSGKTVVLHTNDVHGAVDQYAKLAALKADFAAAGAAVVLVDAGDYSSGDPNVSFSKGASAIELMNAVGYDYATLGNHEFDYGWASLEANLKNAKFAVLSDVQYNGKTAYPVGAVKEIAGLKLGFFGITTPETATKAHPGKTAGVHWPAEAEMMQAAQAAVDQVKADGADLVIGITHLGTDGENVPNSARDLYKEVSGIDFIIDGHSHTVMTAGEAGEPIQSTGTKLVNVGVVVIDNATKKIESNCLFDLANYTKENAEVKAISDRVMKEVDDEFGAVFAKSEVDLDGSNKIARYHETNLGDLIADALVWFIKDGDMSSITVPADNVVALTNGGGIREDIKAGDVTKKAVNTVLPFGNTVAVVYVTGAELLESLEASTRYFPMGGFPQVAGIRYTIDDTKPYNEGAQYPDSTYFAPKTIERVTIDSINGKSFDPNATYAVITNDFLASGGDTYFAFKNASAQFDTSIPMDEAVMEYIKTALGGAITAEKYGDTDGRITIIPDPLSAFSDVNTALWYAPALRFAVSEGIMNGTGNGAFKPDATTTRAEVVTMLWRLEGSPAYVGASAYSDVAGDEWYGRAVRWADAEGVVTGYNGKFNPNAAITREEFATMLYRYEKQILGGGFTGAWQFLLQNPDAAKVSSWADEAMKWMVMNKVVNGVDEAGTLLPQGSATRAAIAQMLFNYSKLDSDSTRVLTLGQSGYSVTVPASYRPGEVSAEDAADDQIAYYKSSAYALDFDVYEFAKGDDAVLASYAAKEAKEYNATAKTRTINGITVAYYEAVEQDGGKDYNTLTYIFESGDEYVEIVFWLDGSDAASLAERIISSLAAKRVLTLGQSGYSVTVPASYYAGEVSAEDAADDQIGYYKSDAYALDFDVYEFAKGDDANLADYAMKEANQYNAELKTRTVNGTIVAYYEATEQDGGKDYSTLTYIFESGDEYVEIVFWLDGSDAASLAEGIISSLAK